MLGYYLRTTSKSLYIYYALHIYTSKYFCLLTSSLNTNIIFNEEISIVLPSLRHLRQYCIYCICTTCIKNVVVPDIISLQRMILFEISGKPLAVKVLNNSLTLKYNRILWTICYRKEAKLLGPFGKIIIC